MMGIINMREFIVWIKSVLTKKTPVKQFHYTGELYVRGFMFNKIWVAPIDITCESEELLRNLIRTKYNDQLLTKGYKDAKGISRWTYEVDKEEVEQ